MSTEQKFIERSVRIIAVQTKYRKTPFPFTVPKDKSGKFITGQDLPEDKINGKKELTGGDRKRLGFNPDGDVYLINPDNTYQLVHGRRFDLAYYKDGDKDIFRNARDHAEFDFFTAQNQVAPSKAEVKEEKHTHYVEDVEAEATVELRKKEKVFEATRIVYEISSVELNDLCLLLNYEGDGFKMDPDRVSPTVLKARILEQAEKNPQLILRYKERGSRELIFALRLIKHEFIRKSGRDYFYKDQYLGSTLQHVQDFISKKENAPLVDKWATLIKYTPLADKDENPKAAEGEKATDNSAQ